MTRLAAETITVRFPGAGPGSRRAALEDAHIAVESGELVGLIGPNGAGKTTLLRVLASLVESDGGRVLLDGVPVAEAPRAELARRIAYLPQGAVVHWPLSVRRLVALGRLPHLEPWRRPRAADEAAIDRAMRETGVAALADRVATTLSGGERVRAMLARALAGEPEVLLADEPVAALDPYHQLQVMELLRRLADAGRAAVAVLHDLTLAARFCHRLVLLHEGRVHDEGPPAKVLNPASLRTVYNVEASFGETCGAAFVVPWRRVESDPGQGASP